DIGFDLGAALLDKAILDYSIQNNPNKAELEEAFERSKKNYRLCEYKCREAKEEYYSYEEMYSTYDDRVNIGNVAVNTRGGIINFEPIVYTEVMRQIVNTPMSDLQGLSWTEAFHALLVHTRNLLDQQGVNPQVILLTGGASKMEFIFDICHDVFPDQKL